MTEEPAVRSLSFYGLLKLITESGDESRNRVRGGDRNLSRALGRSRKASQALQ